MIDGQSCLTKSTQMFGKVVISVKVKSIVANPHHKHKPPASYTFPTLLITSSNVESRRMTKHTA